MSWIIGTQFLAFVGVIWWLNSDWYKPKWRKLFCRIGIHGSGIVKYDTQSVYWECQHCLHKDRAKDFT